jgi:uncharacterized OB-fold protein
VTDGRPLPVPDELSGPFWAAAARHVLTVARCAACQAVTMPPGLTCPHCGSTDPRFAFTPVTGPGVIRSWTVLHQSFLPGFEHDIPFMLVDVEFPGHDGVRFIGRLLDGPRAEVRAGAIARPAFEDLAPEVSVPAFTLAPRAPDSDTRGSEAPDSELAAS